MPFLCQSLPLITIVLPSSKRDIVFDFCMQDKFCGPYRTTFTSERRQPLYNIKIIPRLAGPKVSVIQKFPCTSNYKDIPVTSIRCDLTLIAECLIVLLLRLCGIKRSCQSSSNGAICIAGIAERNAKGLASVVK